MFTVSQKKFIIFAYIVWMVNLFIPFIYEIPEFNQYAETIYLYAPMPLILYVMLSRHRHEDEGIKWL